MAAGTFTIYGANKADIRLNDLVSANIRIALVTSVYTPDVTATGNTLFANVSANELANGNGYTSGGAPLTGTTAANVANTGFKFSTGNAVFTASGAGIPAWRYAVMYYSGTLWGKVNPLIGYFVGDATPADTPATTAGNTLTLTTPTTGWFDET